MSDPEFERRINNRLDAIVENQARFDEQMGKMQEAVAGLIQVAQLHGELIERNSQQIAELRESLKEQRDTVAELRESLKEQRDTVDALIRIVEGHLSNHP